MPIEIDDKEFGMNRDELYKKLKRWNIYSRRYFYPLVCDFACYRSVQTNDPLIRARKIADRILTLPIYDSLQIDEVEKVCAIIKTILCKRDI